MRDIIFKGFCEDNKGDATICINGNVIRGFWTKGFYVEDINGHPCIVKYITHREINGIKHEPYPIMLEVIPETVCEYTGLTDKNGRMIFEGDILECCSWKEFFSKNNEPLKPFQRKFVVAYHNGCMRLREDYDGVIEPNYWDIIFDGDCEVIGTIFDVKG